MTRETVIGRVRLALGTAPSSERDRAVEAWMAGPATQSPSVGHMLHDEYADIFMQRAREGGAAILQASTEADVPALVADIVRSKNLPARIATGSDLILGACLSGLKDHAFEVKTGPASGDDAVSVTLALACIAETGTLMLVSEAGTPTTLNFLPELAICIVPRSRIVGAYEQALAALRTRYPDRLPRIVNFVTGPSRTADIEEILQIGAHGPKSLHVIVVDTL